MGKHYKITKIREKDYRNIYIVGDIHGMFHLLKKELKELGFDKSKDLLVSTGDLIDRGKNSIKAIKYVQKKWFESVFGNHDYKFMNLPNQGYSDLFPPKERFDDEITEKDVEDFKTIFSKHLSGAIEIQLKTGEKIGVVHAGVGLGERWEDFTNRLEYGEYYTVERAIWDRPIAKLRMLKYRLDNGTLTEEQYYRFIERNRLNYTMPELNDRSFKFLEDIIDLYNERAIITDLKALVTGHNIVNADGKILSIGNRHFIDTGAFLTEEYYTQKGKLVSPIKNMKHRLSIINIKEFYKE